MQKFPESGTDSSLRATFRLLLKDSNPTEFAEAKDFIGKLIMLEPFDFPGMVVTQKGKDGSLSVADSADESVSVFRLVAGLDGKPGTVSLELESEEGCFVYSGVNYKAGLSIKLSCMPGSSDAEFEQAVSFVLNDGISEYHPISFVAKGVKRNFVLTPLFTLKDESYSVYLNIQS